MALINCKECGKEISDKALSCPKCGCPVEKPLVCIECGGPIEKTDKICKKCGCPVEVSVGETEVKVEPIKIDLTDGVSSKNVKNKKPMIIGGCIIGIILLFVIILSLGGEDKVVCSYYLSNSNGIFDYTVTYEFEDGVVSYFEGVQKADVYDVNARENLWEIANKNQAEYNYYEGLTYNATFNEDNIIKIEYSLDINKAPKMYETLQTLAGVEGLIQGSTRDDVLNTYINAGFSCEG